MTISFCKLEAITNITLKHLLKQAFYSSPIYQDRNVKVGKKRGGRGCGQRRQVVAAQRLERNKPKKGFFQDSMIMKMIRTMEHDVHFGREVSGRHFRFSCCVFLDPLKGEPVEQLVTALRLQLNDLHIMYKSHHVRRSHLQKHCIHPERLLGILGRRRLNVDLADGRGERCPVWTCCPSWTC